MAKQSYVVPGLIVLVLIYNLVTLPMQTNALSVLAAFAIYGLTGSPVLTFFAMLATPVVVYALPKKERFSNDGAAQISERVKKMRGSVAAAAPAKVTGVLESPGIESFMNLREGFANPKAMADSSGNVAHFTDASGVAHFTDASGTAYFTDASGESSFTDARATSGEDMGAPGVSIPAFVRDQGRMLVVPEFSMPRFTSVDSAPKANPVIAEHDEEGINSALASDATRLPPADESAGNRPSMSAGAPRALAHRG